MLYMAAHHKSSNSSILSILPKHAFEHRHITLRNVETKFVDLEADPEECELCNISNIGYV